MTSTPADATDRRVILQVALDFVDLPRAILVAKEAVAGGADWVEAGTPLIKAEGLSAVRELKATFPDRVIVADMKTIDAGRIEVEYAAKAGAGVVGVLGAASDSTIKECAEAARNYGCKLIVDMVEVADPVARARQAEALGADYIAIHTAIDQQMRGETPFATL
ncbi:MAG TPA: orotidine 5'-phosphate decarboxylase, partial [Thermoleophilia bacterium]|nr:orotidine 5'-phosphate decarboxylase [Thermoleophilia bacterium]